MHIYLLVIFILLGIYYILFTWDGSIRLALLLSSNNPLIAYENIDYENNNNYLNQIEINNRIIYIECKTYGIIKVAKYYK